MRKIYLGIATVLMAGVFCAYAQEHTVIIKDDESASEDDKTEGHLMQDSYGRNKGDGKFRGRYVSKIYIENGAKGAGSIHISALQFPNLKRWLGEGKTILSAKLELEPCNAKNDEGDVQVIAYPILDEWNYQGFCWAYSKYAGKYSDWNVAPAPTHFNITPADDAATASKDMYDIAKTMGGQNLTAYGKRSGSEKNIVKTGGYIEFDITETVRLWYSGKLANNGVALLAPNKGTYVRFFSSNSDSFSPQLVVRVSGPGGVPTPPAGTSVRSTTKPVDNIQGPPPTIGGPPLAPPPPAPTKPRSAPSIPLL